MPSFTWDVSPVAAEIPKNPLMIVVGGIALTMIGLGFARRENDLKVFGVFLGMLLLLGSRFLPDPMGVRWYSLLFVGVFLGGYALLNWQILRGGGPAEAAGDFIVYGVLGVLVGSRLGHVLFYDLDKAIADPLWVLQIWTGGLASHGAVLGLILAMWIFTRRRGVPFVEGADRFAFSAALGATLVRLGNFFNSEIVGKKVPDQSWGVRLPRFDTDMVEAPLRYPTQLYEFGLGLFVMLCLYLADRAAGKEKRPRGLLISVFFVVYFAGRFVVEFWKEQQGLPEDAPVTMGQLLSVPPFAIGVIGLVWALQAKVPAGWPVPDEEDESEDDESGEETDEEDESDESDEEDEESDEDAGEPNGDESNGEAAQKS